MAQLRQDYDRFREAGAEIVVVGPEDAGAFASYWEENDLPFVGLPDPRHSVLKQYGQEVRLFKFGRMPAQVVVARGGTVRYVHYGKSMADIPDNEELLGVLETLKPVGV